MRAAAPFAILALKEFPMSQIRVFVVLIASVTCSGAWAEEVRFGNMPVVAGLVMAGGAALGAGLAPEALAVALAGGLLVGDGIAPALLGDEVLAEDERTGTVLVKAAFDSSSTPFQVQDIWSRQARGNRFWILSNIMVSVFGDPSVTGLPEKVLAFETESDARAYFDEVTRADAAR